MFIKLKIRKTRKKKNYGIDRLLQTLEFDYY
jgi:hypothetical protein